MSVPKTYYVKGRFEGHFRTKQRSFLKSDEPFPKGDEHLVQIYRGIVSKSEEIQLDEFQTIDGLYNFREIQNVQVNTSNHWPIPNDRIFSLINAKLLNVKVSNVQQVGDQNLGEIQGDVISVVIDSKLNDNGVGQVPHNDQDFGVGNNHIFEDDNGTDEKNNTQDDVDNNSGGKSVNGRTKKGCFSWFPNFNWLRWLLYLIAILLLLYLLSRCTQFSQKIYCKIQDWRVTEELKDVKLQNNTLESKIINTTSVIAPCGNLDTIKGDNNPKSIVYDLGEKSGNVLIFFDARIIPDRLEIIYDGQLVASSNKFEFEPYKSIGKENYNLKNIGGFSQGIDTFSFPYKHTKHTPTEVLIRVIPNPNSPHTKSFFKLYCPQ